jgi:hypothetical protein
MRQELTTFPKNISDTYIPLDDIEHAEMISYNVRSLPIINEIDQQLSMCTDYTNLLGVLKNNSKWYEDIVRNTNRTFKTEVYHMM